MDNSKPFEVCSEFQLVSRKRKGRNKHRLKAIVKASEPNSDNSDNSETVVESTENEDEINSNQIIVIDGEKYSEEHDAEYWQHNSRVTTDAQLKVKPQVEPEEISDKIEKQKDEKPFEPTTDIKEHFNYRALSKYAETYELEKFDKKVLLIFNQENVEGYEPRFGTKKDVESLKSTFGSYDFEVTEHLDLNKKEIFDEIEKFFKQDFTNYGCIGIAVLTHGSNLGLLRAKDLQYSEIEIINHFKAHNKPSLVSKPKFLIIQACRGTEITPGVPVMTAGKIRTDMDCSKEPYILPVESDLLILHSSYVGSPSHRDELNGSWFIQALCRKIVQLAATCDLESIITEVKREVAIDHEHEVYNKKTLEMQVNKQMPVLTSTLIRKLYLRKFGDPSLTPLISVSDGPCKCKNVIKNASNEVLDCAPPTTPMLVQFGPCSCFLDHFDYIKNCLRYFVEDFPHDEIAGSYLELAGTFEDGNKFNAAKESLAKAMCKHLTINAKKCEYYKFLYFYKHY